jgi:hypothetical protein
VAGYWFNPGQAATLLGGVHWHEPVMPSHDAMSPDDGTRMGNARARPKRERILSPVERLSEIVFGLIMTLSITGSLSVAESGKSNVRTMLIGAIGCNMAWGIIDALMYLVAVLTERHRSLALFHAVRGEKDAECAHRMIADRFPPLIAAFIRRPELEHLRRQFAEMTIPTARLTRRDLLGALGVFLLVFLSTLPVVLPFLLPVEPLWALRLSNVVAVAMLFVLGYQLGKYVSRWPIVIGGSAVALGAALVGLTIVLGG